jgi:uncharacterized protein YaaN involved in tellurite resistance
LKKQTAENRKKASNSTVEIDKLKQAFQNIYDTMDMMSNYKIKALENMQQTVTLLSDEVEKANANIERAGDKNN